MVALWGFKIGFSGDSRSIGTRIRTWRFSYSIQSRASSFSTNPSIGGGDDGVLPVLIVGAGPVGLVLSILLTKLGVKCAVLEKNNRFSEHPQAHFVNNRSMEIFRKLSGLAEEIQRSQPHVDLWRKFIYCTSLSGSILGSVDHMKPQDFEGLVSPVSVAHFSQYKLTRLLLKQLKNLNIRISTYEGQEDHSHGSIWEGKILMGHEFVSFDVNDHYVTVTASCFKGEQYMERNIKCRTLVGTDGAGSTVRRLAGIEMRGEKDLQNLISVHFLSQDLGLYLLNERPGMLFFVFNPEAIGVLVAHDLKQGEFVLQIPFYPPQHKLEDFSFEMCQRLISKIVGRELPDIKVIDIKPWVMHAEVAAKFVFCDNRIILAGDAAHRFPPAGGFGMNTGIQDAHNLAWKLASVAKGIAPSSILCTYDAERRPIATINTELSIHNFRAAMEVPAALGLDPAIANSVHGIINHAIGSILPLRLQRAILEGIFSLGRAQLSESILNDSNLLGSSRLAKLRCIFEEGRSLQLQFPAEDLGFRYLEGALVLDGDNAVGTPKGPSGRRRDYIPSSDPGSRLPHMNLTVLSDFPNKEIFSTLDVVRADRVEFLLIIAPGEQSYQLAHAVFKVAGEFKLPARVCIMWPHGTTPGKLEAGSKVALEPHENFIDVVEVKRSSSSPSWWDMCQMTEKGAILVRPDEHIAWRTKAGIAGDLVSEMRRVFFTILGFKTS